MNVFYINGLFKVGMCFEFYFLRINGYLNCFDGIGIGMCYVGYFMKMVDVMFGNFYEQFGLGMSFCVYEDWNFGYDNMVDGLWLILCLIFGVQFKGIYGYQCYFFQGGKVQYLLGIICGVDVEFYVNELIYWFDLIGFDVMFGGSFVLKYQVDDNEDFVFLENVVVYGG